jgi:hypothetical protein
MLIQRLDLIAFADSLAQSVPRVLPNASIPRRKENESRLSILALRVSSFALGAAGDVVRTPSDGETHVQHPEKHAI